MHEITIYPASCVKQECVDSVDFNQIKLLSCFRSFGPDNTCNTPMVFPPMTFKVSKTPNEILYWTDDKKIEKYTNCAIKDYKN